MRSPWALGHPVLSRRAVLVAKLIALAWLVTGQATVYPGLRLPVVPVSDETWTVGLTTLGVLGIVLVWLSAYVRLGCLAVAASIGLGIFGDLAFYSNNRLFTAVILGLLGVVKRRDQERWVAVQVGIVFLGAAFDKTLDPDWRSGHFLETLVDGLSDYGLLWSPGGFSGGRHWLAEGLQRAPSWGFRVLSWAIIGLEWVLGGLWLLARRQAVLPNTLFFLGLILLTGSPMGMFAFAGTAVSLLLVDGLAEGDRLGDHAVYWTAIVLLLGSPLFSQALAVLVALLVPVTYTRRFRT